MFVCVCVRCRIASTRRRTETSTVRDTLFGLKRSDIPRTQRSALKHSLASGLECIFRSQHVIKEKAQGAERRDVHFVSHSSHLLACA